MILRSSDVNSSIKRHNLSAYSTDHLGPANNGKVLANSVTNDDTVVAEAASTFQVGRWADLMKYTQPHQWKYDYADTIVDLEALSNDERNCD